MARHEFTIIKGVYCVWCADLMRKTLKNKFNINTVEFDLLKAEVRIFFNRNITSDEIIEYLKKRGYDIIEK